MEDVIFQGSTGRRPVNVAEVSLVFDNSDGTLPIAYQEVVITRRLSRSGQSEYMINRSPVRLRDVQDLLRGTGLGADAAVVMEAKMIEALLSEKAEERRALFEEAAGIGLYRDRKSSTERRLEETGADLARLEDLIAEVQTQVRSLARQRGKAERYGKMIEERFGVALTLVRREMEDLDLALGSLGVRTDELAAALPIARERLADAERGREARVQARHTAEARRTEVERRLANARLEVGRLEGDLNLAAERMQHASQRRDRAIEERTTAEMRAAQAGRSQLNEGKVTLRALEETRQQHAEAFRAREGERQALERERSELRDQAGTAVAERHERDALARQAAAQSTILGQRATERARDAVQAVEALQRARRQLASLQEHETLARSARRQSEEALAQVAARRDALAELDRERVGLAPAAQALLRDRGQFGDAVL